MSYKYGGRPLATLALAVCSVFAMTAPNGYSQQVGATATPTATSTSSLALASTPFPHPSTPTTLAASPTMAVPQFTATTTPTVWPAPARTPIASPTAGPSPNAGAITYRTWEQARRGEYPHLPQELADLVAAKRQGKLALAVAEIVHTPTLFDASDESVSVIVNVDPSRKTGFEGFVQGRSRDLHNLGESEFTVGYSVRVPIGELMAMSEFVGVQAMRLPGPVTVSQQAPDPTAHVAELLNADGWYRAGITGSVKVGLVDIGFDNLNQLVAPGAVDTHCSQLGIGGDRHGTDAAAMVLDVAKNAQLYLAHVDGNPVTLQNAVDCFHNSGVSVISSSIAWVYDSPGDGRGAPGTINSMVTKTTFPSSGPTFGYNMFWAQAAGNSAQQHWQGAWNGAVGGGIGTWHVWPDGHKTVGLPVQPGVRVDVSIRWPDHWGAAYGEACPSGDYDLVLYDRQAGPDDSNSAVLFSSRNLQSTCQTQSPLEHINFQIPPNFPNASVYVAVQRWGNQAPPFELLSLFQFLEGQQGNEGINRNVAGSIENPADNTSGGQY